MTELRASYIDTYTRFLMPIAATLELFLKDRLRDYERRERVSVRPKSVESFVAKSARMDSDKPRYTNPMQEIQDQIGARVITYFLRDVAPLSDLVLKYFKPVEQKLHVPDHDAEFGYIGQHFILFIPTDILAGVEGYEGPPFFELQIQTLFQHAWAEAEHDLGYKPSVELTPLQKRQIAFTAAQAWGADQIFNELAGALAVN